MHVVPVKSSVEISQNFLDFSEYMNFMILRASQHWQHIFLMHRKNKKVGTSFHHMFARISKFLSHYRLLNRNIVNPILQLKLNLTSLEFPAVQTVKWWHKHRSVWDIIICDDWIYLIIVCIARKTFTCLSPAPYHTFSRNLNPRIFFTFLRGLLWSQSKTSTL